MMRASVLAGAFCLFSLVLVGCMAEMTDELDEPEVADESAELVAADVGIMAWENCRWSYSGYVYVTSPTTMQGSATTSCNQPYSMQVTATLQVWNGYQWYDYTSATNWGGRLNYVDVIVRAPSRWQSWVRVKGTHSWWDYSGYNAFDTYGQPTFVR